MRGIGAVFVMKSSAYAVPECGTLPGDGGAQLVIVAQIVLLFLPILLLKTLKFLPAGAVLVAALFVKWAFTLTWKHTDIAPFHA